MKYSPKCADLRMKKWMVWMRSSEADGSSQRKKGSMKRPVLEEEKVSVEAKKIMPDQKMAGHQARSHAGMRDFGGTRWRTSSRLGAERGLRQGSEGGIGEFSFLFLL